MKKPADTSREESTFFTALVMVVAQTTKFESEHCWRDAAEPMEYVNPSPVLTEMEVLEKGSWSVCSHASFSIITANKPVKEPRRTCVCLRKVETYAALAFTYVG